MASVIEQWLSQTDSTVLQIKKQREVIDLLEEEVETILMERIRDKTNAQRYDRMIAKREEQIAQAKKRIAELENLGQVIRSRQAKLKKDISLIDQILEDGQLTETHLRLLICVQRISLPWKGVLFLPPHPRRMPGCTGSEICRIPPGKLG